MRILSFHMRQECLKTSNDNKLVHLEDKAIKHTLSCIVYEGLP